MKRAAAGAIAAILWLACAVSEPPSGGPEDKTPPRAISVSPRPDSAGIDRAARLEILFSEKLDGESFKTRIATYPQREFKRIAVKGERLSVEFKELLPETTVTVVIKAGYQDHHAVPSAEAIVFSFATAETIASGAISGRAFFKKKPDSTCVAALFAVADTARDATAGRESRLAFADDDGYFSFRALPTDSARFILRVFHDTNGDGMFAEGTEFSARFPDTLILSPQHASVEGILLNVIDPNEPGTVEGRVENRTELPRTPTLKLTPVEPGARAIVARVDTTGNFVVTPVPPGSYTLTVFIDMKADSACGDYPSPADSTVSLREPCSVAPDTLVVQPGERHTLMPITLNGGSDE